MTYRTQQAVQALFQQVKSESIDELLHLSEFVQTGWPEEELKTTVKLMRILIDTPKQSMASLQQQGFAYKWLQTILALLDFSLDADEQQVSRSKADDISIAIVLLAKHGFVINRIDKRNQRIFTFKENRAINFEVKFVNHEDRQTLLLISSH
ncbi:hypothetical protein [Vibrio breoganii]|uniref:Uncharacterized protein n=1 Tax=Vibrio breoganii TaxID=553239 RepID=A0ABX1UDT7_9VIBR|nr:hypothetical protein [Vibrio breoganii]NMO75407.1 hypothetical protein [Vibrio breoganii]NMR71950.1 hypothetical protein [Vibrio breoganii]PML92187.1 hypothetical protein BCT67_00290 [Vibrio breoganii]